MKTFTTPRLVQLLLCTMAISLLTTARSFSQTFNYYQCAEVYGTNHAGNLLHVRMAGLHASIRATNTGGSAKTYTVVLKNVDPDFITLSEGTTTAKGANSLTFTWNIAAGATQTVWINPWYLTPWDFYFIVWGDSQHKPLDFQRLLAKATLINPVLSVAAGDCVQHGDDGGCIGGGGRPDVVTDQIFQNYLQLFTNYPTPVFEALGNHDITRGGWVALDDSNYGAGERLWRKYLGPTEYSFTVHPTYSGGGIHFLVNRFYYDMPNWNARTYFGGCTPNGYLRFDNNDSVGVAIYNFSQSDLAAASGAAARISVTHHGFNMFINDHNTVANARTLYQNGNVDYMIVGHQHIYATGTDGPSQIPYLITGDANGTAHGGNPGFSLVHVSNGNITQQHMLADNLNLNINYTANGPTLTQGKATVTCSGYSLPFVRLKFKLSNAHAAYQATDLATNANLATYSHQFGDYTVVYVETSIGNGATRNIQVDPITTASALKSAEHDITVFPNPAGDYVTVQMPRHNKLGYRFVVYDMQGRPVKELKGGSKVTIPLDGLAPGAYLVRIAEGDAYIATKRIIVK
ncbi:T9SS type A sorting domain-containing protein [Chitinophaga japonensis]|uniref:Putative secreted protein (Por secretion system target) n=1 Tax=Chitinophaga japonensis TaxID=104662 RepID=A0A562TD93_CHIJA|nr:T9SS type A sorting domain-containing protein [Chitinophaga japonensis]TWI90970.1 putative secreted protein (Por secretion system target) [Chitinophaga japonensis]